MTSTVVENLEIQIELKYPNDRCPFEQGGCMQERCKFWFGDDCIILKSLKKFYLR
jgi:hypothetical protein